MIDIKLYSSNYKEKWDELIRNSRNGTFLFLRDFMDYHSDRFQDNSLLIFLQDELVAVIPANLNDNILYTHQGLTYGGFIFADNLQTIDVLNIFDRIIQYLKINKINKFIYKRVPHIYNRMPCEEDIYAIFRNKGELLKREISSSLEIKNAEFNSKKKNGYNRSKNNNVVIRKSKDFVPFFEIVNNNLKKYSTEAVHTAKEMANLHNNFPNNIIFYGCYEEAELIGGAIMFETTKVAHAQYIHFNSRGRKLRTYDFLMIKLMKDLYINNKQWFDFGISTEDGGNYLNEGLINHKEEYGGKGICYDTYKLDIEL